MGNADAEEAASHSRSFVDEGMDSLTNTRMRNILKDVLPGLSSRELGAMTWEQLADKMSSRSGPATSQSAPSTAALPDHAAAAAPQPSSTTTPPPAFHLVVSQMLSLDRKPERVAMVGHSQGGCAAFLACRDRVVNAWGVKGLLLVGSESPLEMDGMDWIPRVPLVHIVHADKDAVISPNQMRQVAQRWQVPFTLLDSQLPIPSAHFNDDDIAHDFMTKALIQQLAPLLTGFLQDCARL